MAYTALYRKWRPIRFDEVRGQDHIVKTLINQLNNGRIGHAYLFTGTRGTGKTTMAKIFARAVNCENPQNGNPCNECPTCRAILSGASVNVSEIDAASNNGVENIRGIREEVKYKPTEGKYRVYIIDEVHMLSTGAFNALLKTLEEPPEYVIFILATTEVHKIPITVLSRCQRYDFKRLSLDALRTQIGDLLEAENIEAEDTAVSYIARAADGSSRDALSLLEQCISFYYGEKLTYERVLNMLGTVDQTVFSELLQDILNYDTSAAIRAIDNLLSTGRDLSQFVLDFTWYMRNMLLIQTENPGEDVLGISKDNLELMREKAAEMDVNQVIRYIRILSELSNQLKIASSKRVLFEVAIIKMMMPQTEENLESLTDRIRALEDRAANGSGISGAAGSDRPVSLAVPENADGPVIERTVEAGPALYGDYETVAKDWPNIVESIGRLMRSILIGTRVSVDEGMLCVFFKDAYNYSLADKPGRAAEIEQYLENKYQKSFKIKFKCLVRNEAVPKVVLGKRIPGIEMDITEE